MTAPGRIGDPISCGDFIAEGSSDVFIEDLPVALQGHATTGHSGFPPTILNGPCTTTIFINDRPVSLVGITSITPHKKRRNPLHSGVVVSGATTVEME
jgi:uncharacterized Zn-binding protein involved in type VI secretion